MRLHEQYRKHAADLLKLASRQPNSAGKFHLLAMAEAWLALADRLAKRAEKQPAAADHPLVERILGPDREDAE